MWKCELPNIDAGLAFDKCVNSIRNKTLQKRMKRIRKRIVSYSNDYYRYAVMGRFDLVNSHPGKIGGVHTDNLIKNYNSRMVPPNSAAHPIYQKIFFLAANGKCLFCNDKQVQNLDHFLPISLYPGLSTTPNNLVGCCRDCNHSKGAHSPSCPEDAFIHPYFDDLESHRWLVAELIVGKPISFVFKIRHCKGFDDITVQRLRNQFKRLKLSKQYAIQATDRISDFPQLLEPVYKTGGWKGVKEQLRYMATVNHKKNPNSWASAVYRTLSNSKWYCDGGFLSS